MTGGKDKGRVVLAGGGHAHLYTLTRVRDLVRRGLGVTLVDASPHLHYSGMATGIISGLYAPHDNRLDVRRLVERGGGRFVRGRVAEVRAGDRELVLEGGERVPYDVASFCLGSEVADGLPSGSTRRAENVIRVKPVGNAQGIRDRLRDFRGDRPPRVLVVGGGAAGCEVAANVLALLRDLGGCDLTLVQGGASLLPRAPKRARTEISAFLRSRGARVLTDTRVSDLGGGVARTGAGEEVPYDLAVLATGISPPRLFRNSGLPTGEDGGLLVDSYLRVPGDGRLFGGGDCVSYRGRTLPKLGVFAVRQGPVILHNLQAALEGHQPRRYDPQRRFLYVLNLGDGTGLGVYGDLTRRGRLPYRLKNLIDRRFVEKMSRSR